ncbi:sensor domain-containing phosphodiesterase [Kineococcus auxinigenes]|uniref:sensor domain-containing phosphodiesterase n=1 Tax=unclassified Kineococcus TaxID=2621656 RepID=UPI003D7DC091
MALITLVDEDRVWFSSIAGALNTRGRRTGVRQVPVEMAFCPHVVVGHDVLEVPDASADARFADIAAVSGPLHVRAYAGAPIIGRDGLALGALCVIDRRVRHFEQHALELLVDLAGAVAELLELRRADATAGLDSRQVRTESHRLRAGIDADQMVVHYQPVVELPSGRWAGVEALVRWQHPERGLLPPAAFLPLAEASALIVPLGRQVLESACTQVARWREQVPAAAHLHVAVNVSARQPDITEVITRALLVSGLPAQALVLELTETALAGSSTGVDTALQRIRAHGVRLALDDFGTGYATFGYLQRFHPDIVKIDRCFVAALGRRERDDLLTGALVHLAQQLDCELIAEGVETREQAQVLTTLGVRTAQGHLFSAARDGEDLLTHLLSTRH